VLRHSSKELESRLESFSLSGKTKHVATPSNNKPASTSLKAGSAYTPSSPEDEAKSQLVTQIIKFQAFDGSFSPRCYPVNKSDPGSLAELLGPGLRTLVEILSDIVTKTAMAKVAEVVCWTVAIQRLLEIHLDAYREHWMLVYKKSLAFLHNLMANPQHHPELPKRLLEVQELAKSEIENAQFYAFPSARDGGQKPLNWEKVLSERLTGHFLIPLKLPPTKTDPLRIEEAQRLGRVLEKETLAEMIATQKSAMYGGCASDSVIKEALMPLKQRIMEYEESLKLLAEEKKKIRKKGRLKKSRTTVRYSPCDAWVTTT
jgi:hypothetical protein